MLLPGRAAICCLLPPSSSMHLMEKTILLVLSKR